MDLPGALPASGVGSLAASGALQALLPTGEAAAPEWALLTALAGQDVEVLLQALEPQGLRLQLPTGQSFVAQGELPYPPGTQLTVRVVPPTATSGLRLQTLEATPPPSPAILAPLRQSEAGALLARLQAPEPEAELSSLVQLLKELAPAPAPPATAPATSTPMATLLEPQVQVLPPSIRTTLTQLLDLSPQASTKEISQALARALGNAKAPDELPSQDELPTRLQTLLSKHPEIPEAKTEPAVTWVRQALAPPETPKGSALPPQLAAYRAAASSAEPSLQQLRPDSVEGWLRKGLEVLSNPSTSPREAPFHALQAREGTAFFELPLPWQGNTPLQIWVESEAGDRKSGKEACQRILLGLKFSRLGETRIGMARTGRSLQVRIWTEHPEALESQQAELSEELKTLGAQVDLKILPLSSESPSLRALVAGSSLQAMG